MQNLVQGDAENNAAKPRARGEPYVEKISRF